MQRILSAWAWTIAIAVVIVGFFYVAAVWLVTAIAVAAYTLRNGFEYVERGIARGRDVDVFAP